MADSILIIIIGSIAFIIIMMLIMLHSIKKSCDRIDKSFALMDACLKKCWNLVPNLIETVKVYLKQEKATLEEVIRLRNRTYDNMDLYNKIKIGYELETKIKKLLILSENYPELKVNANFLRLIKQFSEVEDEMTSARTYYNSCIRMYNSKLETFPFNIIAKIGHFKRKESFEITEK